jgi:hypothetical protein
MRKMNLLGLCVSVFGIAAAPLGGCKKEEPAPVATTPAGGTAETPKNDAPKNDAPKNDAPAEAPKADPAEAQKNDAPAEAPKADAPPTPVAAEPVLKLIEAGAEPRTALRIAPTAGTSEVATMTMKMTMEMDLQGQKIPVAMPPFVMKMGIDITEVAASGDFTYKMALKEATVGEDPSGAVNPAVLEQMRGLIGKMQGLGGEATVNARGAVVKSDFVIPPDAPQELKQVMDSLQQSMGQISVPFPEEAVGVGAKWEVTTEVAQGGMKIGMVSKFELKSIEGNVVTIAHEIVQTAGAQVIEGPGMPAGAKATLLNLNGGGRGEGVFKLDGVLPTAFATAMNIALSMEVDAAGQKQALSMKTDLDLKLTRD